ncbi:hypothetical protein [Oceanibaculum indicum]|uniref:Uncharacterized protein n=1 Tax=Oceanibaculum indicum TaxID=526216 RepID=A0A420WHU7_9PROT|nr:hypothetical protein [Oceanibaculum indicum]RKQ70563.1 hypothetical protein BCL74_2511 [Oceanibaculum indicum]
MSLDFDPKTQKIIYRGKEVGERIFKNGRSTVRLNIEYQGGDDWSVPLNLFALGLSILEENQPALALLTVRTSGDSMAEDFKFKRFLIEKLVKRGGYIWNFHKSDSDNWPSPLHGHDYEKGLKLDAITGEIYDVATRMRCNTLRIKDLKAVQANLRASKDFKEAVVTLIDDAATATGSA